MSFLPSVSLSFQVCKPGTTVATPRVLRIKWGDNTAQRLSPEPGAWDQAGGTHTLVPSSPLSRRRGFTLKQRTTMLSGNAQTADTLLLARRLLRFALFAHTHKHILKSRQTTIDYKKHTPRCAFLLTFFDFYCKMFLKKPVKEWLNEGKEKKRH